MDLDLESGQGRAGPGRAGQGRAGLAVSQLRRWAFPFRASARRLVDAREGKEKKTTKCKPRVPAPEKIWLSVNSEYQLLKILAGREPVCSQGKGA